MLFGRPYQGSFLMTEKPPGPLTSKPCADHCDNLSHKAQALTAKPLTRVPAELARGGGLRAFTSP